MDIHEYNRQAWNSQVDQGNEWTRPVTSEQVDAARKGDWRVLLTGHKPVPRSWFPPMKDLAILALASGGGQQGPILAAAGAKVTVFDNSDQQLAQDRMVAERDGLKLETVQGDMTHLNAFADASFDLVFNPCSISFVRDAPSVWREAFRVLKPGGSLLTGFLNPTFYIFDENEAEKGRLVVRHKLPYADEDCLTEAELQALRDQNEPLMFGHALTDLIGGQTAAGFLITDLYEDTWEGRLLSDYMPSYIVTKALKPNQ